MDLEADGAEGGTDEAMGPPRDDAIASFTKHKGKDLQQICMKIKAVNSYKYFRLSTETC